MFNFENGSTDAHKTVGVWFVRHCFIRFVMHKTSQGNKAFFKYFDPKSLCVHEISARSPREIFICTKKIKFTRLKIPRTFTVCVVQAQRTVKFEQQS